MSWHKDRFIESASKMKVNCVICQKSMWLPPSKAGKYKTCGGDCVKILKTQDVIQRARNCECCGVIFTPRAIQVDKGKGKFCSKQCAIHGTGLSAIGNSEENRSKRSLTLKAQYQSGAKVQPKGAAHSQWTGGRRAWWAKNADRISVERKKQRAANPTRYKEYVAKRRGVGRLPRGTVNKIGTYQRWKCAVCRKSIAKNYHIDHVMPLALGGVARARKSAIALPALQSYKKRKRPIEVYAKQGVFIVTRIYDREQRRAIEAAMARQTRAQIETLGLWPANLPRWTE